MALFDVDLSVDELLVLRGLDVPFEQVAVEVPCGRGVGGQQLEPGDLRVVAGGDPRTFPFAALHQADHVPLGVEELGEGNHVRHGGHRRHGLRAERLGRGQPGGDVFVQHVEDHRRLSVLHPSEPAVDPTSGVRIDHDIVAGHRLRVPTEELRVELRRLFGVRPVHLEVHHRVAHL